MFELSGKSIPLSDIRHGANVPMSAHTTFHAGGNAKEMFFPKDMDELVMVKRCFAGPGVKCMVVGKGSNLLFDDEGYDGVIINIDKDFARAEVEEIRARSAVKAEEWPYTWENGVLTLRAELGVNDVYGFVIR